MTQLSAAESKFFESRGADVDPSLTGSDPAPADDAPAASEPQAAPPPPAAVQPAAQPPAQPPAQPQTDSRQVPIEALHAERRQRQQLEQQMQAMQQQWTQLQQALQQQAQPQDQPPDPDADPIGYTRWENRQLRQQIEQLGQRFGQQEQMTQQQVQAQRLTQHLTASEAQFSKSQPDYFQAADFAIQREDLRLQAFYPDPAVRQQILRQEIANVVTQAMQSGANPAQIIYQHAKNMGYQQAAAPPVGGAPPAQQMAAPAAPQSVPDVVSTIERGLKQQTRSGSGGSTPPSEMTPEMLLAMNGDEFQKGWNKAFGKKR